ncbi:MAG: site-2 protease family protein [Dehalococcoidia bacterium]|nr:site-2 protease family protein [Dehalococcoidia bacterium]MDH4292173.1 site-2 protease family protein [Dehalococcoidia bacterium]
MKGNISLGRVFGIPLRLHYTWFIIFAWVTFLLVFSVVDQTYPIEQRIILGILTSLLFFASVITHELAHSILAIRNNIPVKEITLFIFGGVSQITKEATTPRAELSIAIVGPLTSLAIAGIFYGLHLLLAATNQILAASSMWWLAWINVFLAVFNLIPGFPLDGGRIFRAFVWQRTRDYHRATRIATKVGQGIAYVLMAVGITSIFTPFLPWFNGLLLIFIGWFLRDAARGSYQQVLLRDALIGITARQVTDYASPLVPPHMNLTELVEQYVLPTGRDCFLISWGAELEGMVTLQQIKKVPRTGWVTTTVQDIMTPANKLKVAHADQDLLGVLQEMSGENTNHIPVMEAGKVIGMINREDVARFLRTHAQFGTLSTPK